MSPGKQSRTSQVSLSHPQHEALEKFYTMFKLRATSTLCSSLFPGFRKQTCLCSVNNASGEKGAVPELCQRLSSPGLAAGETAPGCRWFGMLGSRSVGGGPLLVPRAVPRPLTASTAPLRDSRLAAWEPAALPAPDGTEHLVFPVL